jgi:hypothetical protein
MGVRQRLERGFGMRVERGVQGVLILAALAFGDLRPAYVAFALLALQAVVSPMASPFALLYVLLDRADRPARLTDVYYDATGTRGAAAISCLVMALAFVLIRYEVPVVGPLLLGAPCASCLLAATVGFCAGCGYFVLGRDLIVHRTPEGAVDVQLSDVDQQQVSASS